MHWKGMRMTQHNLVLNKCQCNNITAIQHKFNSRHWFSESGLNSLSMASELLYYDSDSRNIIFCAHSDTVVHEHRKTTNFLLPSHLTEAVFALLGWVFNLQLPKNTMKWNGIPLKSEHAKKMIGRECYTWTFTNHVLEAQKDKQNLKM